MDCTTRRGKHRQYGCCPLAHIWHHTFPVARGLSGHACGAHDIAASTSEFLPEESGAGCAAELLFHSKPEGESVAAGRDEQCGQGESGGLMRCTRSLAITRVRCGTCIYHPPGIYRESAVRVHGDCCYTSDSNATTEYARLGRYTVVCYWPRRSGRRAATVQAPSP